MAKPRLSCSVSPLIIAYVDAIQRRGFHGDTRSEVVRRLLCDSIMDALPGETIQQIVAEYTAKKDQR